ncbi:uncharacterized protein [Battus philenor]|uniref:uncharacterized protein n=1 Tax=Battus philenor TaxID=42288 RepID=UPI0035D0E8F8
MALIALRRWYRARKYKLVILFYICVYIFGIVYFTTLKEHLYQVPNQEVIRRKSVISFMEKKLQEALTEDKGTGCDIPKLDPFAKEITQFDKVVPKVVCPGKDWVNCYHSKCKVVDEILETTRNVICLYSDIIYINDTKYKIGPKTKIKGGDSYTLTRSDHVKVKCIGSQLNSIIPSKWEGHCVGFRSTVRPQRPPPGRENTLNVLILGFDSTSHNGFLRRMPKSYGVLLKELRAIVLDGYNIVGDGTPAALFPILTGRTELELPDVRKRLKTQRTLDSMPFIFYKLKADGYRTAYFEDMPWLGTFQYRFNGFRHQPADHYLRSFFMEESGNGKKWWKVKSSTKYCVGATPQYKLMLNITDQFLKLDGKRFCFTFIADITHDDFNVISTADDDLAEFLRGFQKAGHTEDTLLIVMGDHGPRYAKVRDTLQGKLEERLPMMALVLPESLRQSRPRAHEALQHNAHALTTPHDIYATITDALNMRHLWNTYKVTGADFTRGLTLLELVPRNRSCSEAGIEPHWCTCLTWRNISEDNPVYWKTAQALVNYINSLTESVRKQCAERTLKSVAWVMQQSGNSRMLSFVSARDADGYFGRFGANVRASRENYQVKIVVGPGKGVYEASMTYLAQEDRFEIDSRDISRTNAYNNEPRCISDMHPHLNMYCFCNS